jgi:outer membrane protein with beta-barrel domain
MKRVLFCALVIFICLPALAQQTDVNRYTVFTGFDYLVSPARNLTARGFEGDFGVTLRPWLGLGGDFSAIGSDVLSGAGTITGTETVFAPLLTAAAPLGAPPPGAVHVPFKSSTYTFAAGTQFYLRKWEKVTFFARPGLGGIHEKATLTLPPQLGGLLMLLGAPVPSPQQTDTAVFFGVGGGFDLNVSRPLGVRFAADWVNTHLFSNLLTNRQNYIRFSVGPTFRWGHLK